MWHIHYTIPLLTISLNISSCFICVPKACHTINLCRLYVDRKEVYRLRRQSEILKCMSAVLNNISQTEEQIGNIGITKVHLSPDCTHARISVHIDGDHNSVQRSLAWLGRHSKTLRFQMGTKLNHRKRVPVIQFVHDKTTGFNLFDIRDMIKEATQNELNNANPKSDSVQENPIDFDEATNIATDTNGDNSNYPHDENENGETGKMDIDYPDLEDEDDKMDNMVNDEQLEEFLSDFDEKHVKAVLDSLKDI